MTQQLQIRRYQLQLLLVWQAVLLSPLLGQEEASSCSELEGSCKADTPSDDADTGRASDPARIARIVREEASPLPRPSLVRQEVDELRAFIRNCEARIRLLEELRATATSNHNNSALASFAEIDVTKALHGELPAMADVAGDEDSASRASAADFVVSASTISQGDPVAFMKLLPLRSNRAIGGQGHTPVGQLAMPTSLVIAVTGDGTVRVFTPAGEMALTFPTGHEHPVVLLNVPPTQNDYLIATADSNGNIRTHKLTVRPWRLTREEKQARRKGRNGERISQHLGLQVNVTSQLQATMRLPQIAKNASKQRLTCLVLATHQGSRYLAVGDDKGRVTIFTKTGELHAELEVYTGVPIQSLSGHIGSLVWVSGGEWGFIDLEEPKVRYMSCSKFSGRITAAIIEGQQSQRVFAADEHGSIWVFSMKSKSSCRIDHRFPERSTGVPVELATINGFLLALDRSQEATQGRASVVALNMSVVGKVRSDPNRGPAVTWRRWIAPPKSWSVLKRSQQADLMAILSKDGMEIEVIEVLMQVYAPPMGDVLGNLKLPVFAVAIIFVIGFQYVRNQNSESDMHANGGEVE